MIKENDRSIPVVDDIQTIKTTGPWNTKSGGNLNVIFSISFTALQNRYLNYDYKNSEFNQLQKYIRGLRIYTIRNLPKNGIGGTEWHRTREEIVFCLEGLILWICEDLFGKQKEFIININTGIWIPPFILHTYKSLEEKSGLLIIANNVFIPDDSKTYDTYSIKMFRDLQSQR
jgi:hypothetical protein